MRDSQFEFGFEVVFDHGDSIALLTAVLLAACQSNPTRPVTKPTVEPMHTGTAMRNACKRQAKKQRLEVLSIGSFRTVTGSGGREIGADARMGVSRAGSTYNVLCSYSFGKGRARITSL